MHRLLVINPNTSTGISQVIENLVREETSGQVDVSMATATFGFSYISTRVAVSVAAHAVLDAAARAIAEGARPDAILIACFGDPGREALAELTGLPVVGFAEAGLCAMAQMQGRALVATNGAVWCDMLAELILQLGIQEAIAGIRSIEAVGENPPAIAAFLNDQARMAGAERILLGGAGLIPALPQIIAASRLPIVDPHRLAIRKALELASSPHASDTGALLSGPGPAISETFGLSPHLSAAVGALPGSGAAANDAGMAPCRHRGS
jgi:Asp/Glu/hydantoin racemase